VLRPFYFHQKWLIPILSIREVFVQILEQEVLGAYILRREKACPKGGPERRRMEVEEVHINSKRNKLQVWTLLHLKVKSTSLQMLVTTVKVERKKLVQTEKNFILQVPTW